MVGVQNKISLHCHRPVTGKRFPHIGGAWTPLACMWAYTRRGVKGADLSYVRMPLTTFQEALIAKCCHRIIIEYCDLGRISDLP